MVAPERRRLGELLLDAGLISQAQLKAALAEQRKWGGRLGTTVVELGFVTETALCELLADQLQLPAIDLDGAPMPPKVSQWLRLDLCEKYGVFPLGEDADTGTLSIATADPTNVEHLEAIEAATERKVTPRVATASAIDRAIRKYYFHAADGEATATTEESPEPYQLDGTTLPADAASATPDGPVAVEPAAEAAAKSVEPSREELVTQTLAFLREKSAALEENSMEQVRALRVLLELLIESGLVSRAEYLEKLGAAKVDAGPEA